MEQIFDLTQILGAKVKDLIGEGGNILRREEEEEGKDEEEEECFDESKMQKYENNDLIYPFPLNEL